MSKILYKKYILFVLSLVCYMYYANLSYANPLLELALQGNLAEIKKALADPNYSGNDGLAINTLSGYSASQRKITTDKPDINAPDQDGWTPLMKATMGGHLEVVRFLIENGANINAQDNIQKHNSLMLAAAFSQEEILKALIDAGANIEEKDSLGWTALTHACYNGHSFAVAQLLNNKAEFDMQTNNSWTALMIAAHVGHTESIELLLQVGADIDKKNNDGWTALMIAGMGNHIEVVHLLLEYGADVYILNKNKQTVLDLAQKGDYPHMVKYLQEHIKNTPLF